MTGPQHYQEAERLLALAGSEGAGSAGPFISYDEQAALTLADAQVHATLAQAAATALGERDGDVQAWVKAAGTKRGGGA
jgi:hypothetical protein